MSPGPVKTIITVGPENWTRCVIAPNFSTTTNSATKEAFSSDLDKLYCVPPVKLDPVGGTRFNTMFNFLILKTWHSAPVLCHFLTIQD